MKKIIILRIATVKSLNLIAQGIFLVWQTAVLEHSLSQQSEIQYQPFYINSPPVRSTVSFDARLYMCKTYSQQIV
jgi:hypothetical protein